MKKIFKSLILSIILGASSIFFVSCTCATQIENHTITTTSSNIQKGTVSIGGIYRTNSTVTLNAMAKTGYEFIAWVKSNTIVSRESEFSFLANKETEGKYTALFTTDELEFFMIDEISYDITGLEMNDGESVLNRIENIDIKSGTTSGLYQPLGNFEGGNVENTGNFLTKNFLLQEKIFYLNKEYYFTASFQYSYYNSITGVRDSNQINVKFNVNFNNLSNGEFDSETKTTTYTSLNYVITLVEGDSTYSINVEYTALEKPQNWNVDAVHFLNFKFSYPIMSTQLED